MSGDGEPRSFLVECYWPGVDERVLRTTVHQARASAAGLRLRGRQVYFVGTIFVPSDETVFWLFHGTEADVREASILAEIPFERVLESLRIDGDELPMADAGRG